MKGKTKIILFCGIPGSGKTTIANLLFDKLKKRDNCKIIHSDDLKSPHYPKIFRFVKENIGSPRTVPPDRNRGILVRGKAPHQNRFRDTVEGQADFLILDATFYKKKWQDEIYSLAKGKAKVITIFIICPLPLALKRNKARPSSIPQMAVHMIYKRFFRPRKPDLILNTQEVSSKKAASEILKII